MLLNFSEMTNEQKAMQLTLVFAAGLFDTAGLIQVVLDRDMRAGIG